MHNNGNHFCGGSILNERFVLTAAHCISGMNTNTITVNAGMTFQNTPGATLQSFDILSVTVHPNYNANENDFDIAIIEIDGVFQFNNFVQPVDLITQETIFAENIGTNVRVSGWGWTTPGEFSPSNQLQAVVVPIITNFQADQELDISSPNHTELTQNMIATGAVAIERQGGCHGDSGGPLVFRQLGVNDIQVGVVSWGVPQCNGGINSPTIYARISEFNDWITNQIWEFEIEGQDVFCNSEVYSIAGLPMGGNIDWEVFPAGIVNLSNPINTTITLNQIQSGSVELIANINLPTGVLSISKNIDVGTEKPIEFLEAWYDPYLKRITLRVENFGAGYTYNWIVEGTTYNNKTNAEKFRYNACPSSLDDIRFRVQAVNSCGTSQWLFGSIDRDCDTGGGPFPFTFRVSSNPTKDQLNIQLENQPNSIKKRSYDEEFKVFVINQLGNIELQFEDVDLTGNQSLDVSNLRNGLYTIVIENNGIRRSKQFIIQK